MKKIFLVFILVLNFILLTLVVIIFSTQNSYSGRSVYLNPNLLMPKNFEQKEIHTFFGDEADNLALYKPGGRNNNINEATFFGEIDQYDYLEKPNVNLSSWKNDNINTQIVIKNNIELTNNGLEASLVNENELLEQGIEVKYGFSGFVYASRNLNNHFDILHPWAVHDILLVPEKLTEEKNLNNIQKNKINILFIRILTKSSILANDYNLTFNFSYQNEVKATNTINLKVKDYELPEFDETTSVFGFSNFSRAANYWSNGKIPSEILAADPTDPRLFIKTIWPYVQSDYEYSAKVLKNKDFISNILPMRNPANLDQYYWTTEAISISLMEWRRSISGQLYATDRSWEAMEWYLTQMYNLGMRNFFMQGLQATWETDLPNFFVFDETEQKYVAIPIGMGPESTPNLFQVLEHIKSQRKKWEKTNPILKDIDFYIYTDEQRSRTNEMLIKWLDEYDLNREFYKIALTMWERDLDYDHMETFYTADYVSLFLLDLYNEGNKKYNKLIEERNKRGKRTGQYALDGNYTFTLTRADPGINSYFLLALRKEKSGHYLKYSTNAWNPAYNTWSSDYEERDEYKFDPLYTRYLSGEPFLSYPYKKPVGEALSINDPVVPFISTTRLESLVQGKNLIKKINVLEKQNKLSSQDIYKLYQNIDIRNKENRIMSSQKFNLNFSKTSLVNEINKRIKINSSIIKWLSKKNLNFDEVTAYKVIKNLVNSL